MHKPLLAILTALSLGWAATGTASAATPGVRDAANMFSAGALKEADEKLAAVHKAHGWEIVIETIDTVAGKPIDHLTEDKARSLQIRGVYFLVAKKEGKTHFWI